MSDDPDRAPQENPTKDQSDWVTGDEPMTGPAAQLSGHARAGGRDRGPRAPDQGAGLRVDRRVAADHRPWRLMVTTEQAATWDSAVPELGS
jgi:hypothetical protein